ncbi:MAG TPA: hypothetical protein VH540_22645 [Ktedonobacterales bacterium]|jgi:hypothetical protein
MSLDLTSLSQSQDAIGLCYQEVFTFTPAGGRSSPLLCNLRIKQANGVEPVSSGRVPPDNLDEDHFTRASGEGFLLVPTKNQPLFIRQV